MKPLNLAVIDVNFDSIANLLKLMSEIYEIKLVSSNPDFIIHSCFDHQVLKFDGVRIAWLGENIQPDFNISDYGMGFGRISFQDRYKRIPLYRWYFPEYESLFNEDRTIVKVNSKTELMKKKRFCTMVVSNSGRGEYFDQFLNRFSQYKSIDSGGRWNNNIGGPVLDKMAFIGEGKFHIAFENSSTPGYVTEKIMHAFAAHTIPIYWGAPDVVEDFNPNAFINCHQYRSIDEVVEKIKEIDQDDSAYCKMLEEPCFSGGREPDCLSKDEIMSWIKHIFDQPKDQAYRRNRHYWGKRYQEEHKTAFFIPHMQFAKIVYRKIRKMMLKSNN